MEIVGNEYFSTFRFTIDGRVHMGEVAKAQVDNNPRFWRFWFSYHPRYGSSQETMMCRADITFSCSQYTDVFQARYVPMYIMNALRRKDFSVNELVMSSQNIHEFLQQEDVEADVAHKIVGEEIMTVSKEYPGSSLRTHDICYSTGLGLNVVDRAIDFFALEDILKRMMFRYEFRLGEGQIPRLRSLIDDGSNSMSPRNRYFGEYDLPDRVKSPFVFVLMPFNEEECPQEFYSQELRRHLWDMFGITCERADNDKVMRIGMEKIYNYIKKADIIVAELTSKNANVMYELGLAQGLSKETVIFTRDISSLPFDLRPFTVIKYDSSCLKERWCEALKEHFPQRQSVE